MPLGLGGAEGFGSLGILLMPVGIAAMLLKQPRGPVATLIEAGAVSSDTARRPDKVGIPRTYVLDPAVRRGIVLRTEDGRYWVDIARARRTRRRRAAGAAGIGFLLILVGWSILGTWTGPGDDLGG